MPADNKGKGKEPKQRKKPGRVPTSCAECRRLKLRCDKNVNFRRCPMGAEIPCGQCVKRGCGSICPDGVLTPGKNGRLVLAGTEELHDRISHFSSRIRDLEGALQALQTQVSDAPHPLLLKDSLGELTPAPAPLRPTTSSSADPISTPIPGPSRRTPPTTIATMEPDPAAITEFSGTLSVSGNGQSSFCGPTARLERPSRGDAKPSRLSSELFEFACEDHTGKKERLGNEIFHLRPSPSEASRLLELYLQYGKVMYSPVPRTEVYDEIFMPVYRAGSFSDLQPDTLALLFMVFAISIHFDPKRRSESHDANEYYYLAKASLHLASDRENTLHYIQTLIHMSHYLHFSGSESALSDSRSDYLSRAIRIGFKMGLHLHGVRWDLPDDLAQRRSRMFCEIFLLDTWTSFYSGRPPMVSLAFMDRTTPKDIDEGVDSEGNKKPGFHTWTYKYAILLHSIMAVAFGPKPPPYSTILDLDLKIRNFPVPMRWRPMCEPEDTPAPPPDVQMVRFMVSFAKESTLLNLHRSYFISALEEMPNDLPSHPFIPSVLAIYRSAWRLMRGLRFIWDIAPELVSKMSVAWSQALSAAVIICLFVTMTPGSHLTGPALNELDLLIVLFEEAVPTCRAASDLILDLRSLRRHSRLTAGRSYQDEGYVISTSDLGRLNGKTYLLMQPEAGAARSTRTTPNTGASHRHPGSRQLSTSRQSAPVKRDPSSPGSASATLSEFPVNPQFTSSPVSSMSLHPALQHHSVSSDAAYSHHHAHPHVPYTHSHSSSSNSHTPTPISHVSDVSATHPSQPSASTSSPSKAHFIQPAPPPAPISSSRPQSTPSSLHPTILQDIHDFTMRGAPASSSAEHYFDFPPQEDVDDASMSVRVATQIRGSDTSRTFSGSVGAHPTSAAALRTRGHSVPEYQSHQYQTPTPAQPHAHSHSPSALGAHQDSEYGFFQSLESSFGLEYMPQPRSPFTAANFNVTGMSGGVASSTMHASYQELVEHLGFH
ncbi:hypothetical protein NP233_g1815 [Leucocoprinus birnbaumii]|uniref:Zn(2)-C6 fungal-type domain-containing protein n=1 Tax=Leucocoprinus birnbaumii TaxID=56174 RepID=A0AAD5YVF7_9AGAR|nr:hypothetical protein NP233_g1815 [Leucocoprinus birnbaumii]